MAVIETAPIRIEFIARNLAYGSYLRRKSGVAALSDIRGTRELTLKDDRLDDPPMSEEDAVARGWITSGELGLALGYIDRITDVLTPWFASRDLSLGDLKMEVGRPIDGSSGLPAVIVIDDIGFDNIRVFQGNRLLDIEELHQRMGLA